MNSRRTVILIVAVVVGALAAVGLLNYVKNAESTAGQEAAPVQMWVVKQVIPKGTPIETAIEGQLIGLDETAAKYRPATAVVDPATELAGLVAVTDLPVNMPVLTGSFVSPNIVNTGITDRLEERGLVTVTFTVDQARGAAYLIEPGDFVNVMAEREWDTPFFEEDPPIEMTAAAVAELAAELEASDTTRPILTDLYPVDSRVVYQKAEVLAIGTSLVPDLGQTAAEAEQDDGDAINQSLVTLAVPPEAVQVILNVGRSNLYLSLVPDDYEPRPLPPLDPTTQVLPGEAEGRLTPYAGIEGYSPVSPDELLFADPEDRIGVAPSGGSDDDGGSTGPNPDATPDGAGGGSGRGATPDPTEPTDPDADPEAGDGQGGDQTDPAGEGL